MKNNVRDIIVMGASAGGVKALCTVTASLPPDLPAAVFVVMHVPPWRNSSLPQILRRCSRLPAVHPQTADPIEHGRIYIAPPDRHLLIDSGDRVQIWHGPKENNCRPAINALFRSAAAAYGSRVTGVILSGSLDDGSAGLWWIKRMGGMGVVQNPAEAEFGQMPASAISHVQADFIASADKIGGIVVRLAQGQSGTAQETDEGLSK